VLYGYSENDTARISASVRAFESGRLNQRSDLEQSLQDRNVAKVPFRNDNSGTVPAYGLMRVTGMATVEGKTLFTIDKPNTSFNRLYLVNGPTEVLTGKRSWGYWLWHADYVLYDTGNTPADGESWGPQDNTWTLKKYRYGFTIMGGNTGTGAASRTIAVQHEVLAFTGKTDASHAKSATGTISVYDGNDVDTSINVASVKNKYADLDSGKWVDVSWRGGNWELTAGEC
jgi:hypothetical protein